MRLEATAAAAWRDEMTRATSQGGAHASGQRLKDSQRERAQQRVKELIRQAALQRGPAGLDAPLETHALREAFTEALLHARHAEEARRHKVTRGGELPEGLPAQGDELRAKLKQMLLTERTAARTAARPRPAWEREPPRKGEGGTDGRAAVHWRELQAPRAGVGADAEGAAAEAPLSTTLTLAQAFSLLSTHKLLGGKLTTAADLRTWLSDLLDFKPARAAIAGEQNPSSSAAAAIAAVAPAPSRGASSSTLARKAKVEILDERAFVRLLNDIDPLARLRDSAGKLAALVAQMAAKVPRPRGAARLTAERHLKQWRAKCQQLDEQLSSIAASVRAHVGVLVARQLRDLLPVPARPPSQPLPQDRPQPQQLPALVLERATRLFEWDEPPRTVYAATDLDGAGSGVARMLCVAVLTEPRAGGVGAAGGQKAAAGSTRAEHAALELSVAKLLAGSTGSFFSRCLGSVRLLPSLLQPDPELHIVYEYLAHQRAAHGLVQVRRVDASCPGTQRAGTRGRGRGRGKGLGAHVLGYA